jgi:zinc protease
MRQLTLPEEEFAKERQVVKEERRLRTEDDPQALAAERFFAVAYLTSPYRQPVIGWMDDLDHLTRTDLEGWYQTWYAPNNAVVVVVGDVDPQQVRAQVQRHFGGLAPSRLPQRKPIREIEPSGARRIVVKAPAKLPYLLMGYQVPVVSTTQEPWEPYALDVLADVLDGGDSARLTRDLIRGKEVASQLAADYQMYTGRSGLLQFEGIPNTGHDATELEVALRAQVERLREAPISATELQRVKSQAIADEVFARDSLFYQGLLMGRLEAVGLPWKRMDEYVERIQAVTAEQVQEVARRYLVDDRLTVAVLEPLPLGKPTERPPAAGRMEQDVR